MEHDVFAHPYDGHNSSGLGSCNPYNGANIVNGYQPQEFADIEEI